VPVFDSLRSDYPLGGSGLTIHVRLLACSRGMGSGFALVEAIKARSLTLFGCALAFVRRLLAVIGDPFALVRGVIAIVGDTVALVADPLPRYGLTLARLDVPLAPVEFAFSSLELRSRRTVVAARKALSGSSSHGSIVSRRPRSDRADYPDVVETACEVPRTRPDALSASTA
jgi:hypothetical protein